MEEVELSNLAALLIPPTSASFLNHLVYMLA